MVVPRRDIPAEIDPRGQGLPIAPQANPAYSTLEYQRYYLRLRQRLPLLSIFVPAKPPCDDAPTCSAAALAAGVCSNHQSACPMHVSYPNHVDENDTLRFAPYPATHQVCEICFQHGRREMEDKISSLALYRAPGAVTPQNLNGVQWDYRGFRGLFCKDCTRAEIGLYLERLAANDENGQQLIPDIAQSINHYPRRELRYRTPTPYLAFPPGTLPFPDRTPYHEIAAKERHWVVQDFCTCIPSLFDRGRKCHGLRNREMFVLRMRSALGKKFCEEVAIGPRGIGKASNIRINKRRAKYTPLACPCGKDSEMPAPVGKLIQHNSVANPDVIKQLATFCFACGGIRIDPNVQDYMTYAVKGRFPKRRGRLRTTRNNAMSRRDGFVDFGRIEKVLEEEGQEFDHNRVYN